MEFTPEKIAERLGKIYDTDYDGGHRDAIIGACISELTTFKQEMIKKIARVKTRDSIGGFRHIEVYRDELISLLKD